MEYGKMLGDSVEYAREAVWGKWTRWILLIVSTIIFPLLLGYVMEIYRGTKPAPELEHWGKLFIDGLKLIVAWLIYMIPVIVVVLLFGGWAVFSAIQQVTMSGNPDYFTSNPELIMPLIATFLVGLFIALVLALIIGIIATIGSIRMARKERFGEAFNFSGIFETIRTIGWGRYILALIVLFIVMMVFWFILAIIMAIPYIGWLIYLVLIPLLSIFQARYLAMVYNEGEELKAEVIEAVPV
jgi:MFS family permease